MSFVNNTSLVRQLVAKSYHFDGYNEINCQNSRDKPFFSDNVITFDNDANRCLTIRLVNQSEVSLEFSSVCAKGRFVFTPYKLTLEHFIEKLKKMLQNGADYISFEIKPQYLANDDICYQCDFKNEACHYLLKQAPKSTFAAISFDSSKAKKALAMYFGIINQQKNTGGFKTMGKNNFLGMSFEFGVSKDPNIAATLMGVAVKNQSNGNWYTFDPTTVSRKNIAGIKMGSFPIILVPTNNLSVGKLTKIDGNYYYIKSVNPGNTLTLINAADGTITEKIKEENIFFNGLNYYTEVIAFDPNSFTNPASKENVSNNILAAICMMQWTNGNKDEFSLDNINDDSFNGLGSYLPLLLATNGNNGINSMFKNADNSVNLPMIMALGSSSGDSDKDQLMQMMLLSSLLGGNSAIPGINNPISVGNSTSTEEASVICENCNQKYSADVHFCPKCGSKTKELAKTCKHCGAKLKEDAKFCHVCGKKTICDCCPACGAKIEGNENFCPACGTAINAPVTNTTEKDAAEVKSTPSEGEPVKTEEEQAKA